MTINFTVNFPLSIPFLHVPNRMGQLHVNLLFAVLLIQLKIPTVEISMDICRNILYTLFEFQCFSNLKKKLILLYFILSTHNKKSVRSFLYRSTAQYYVTRHEFSRHKYQTHSTHVLKDLKKNHCLSFIACLHCKNVYFKLSLFEIVKNGCVNRDDVTGPKNNLQYECQ